MPMDEKKVKKLNDLDVLKKLFNAVTEHDILRQVGNDFYVGGKKIPEEVKQKLLVDAQVLRSMDLFRLLMDCMKYEANKQLYETSKTPDDLIFGKAMLLTIDILQKKVDKLAGLK